MEQEAIEGLGLVGGLLERPASQLLNDFGVGKASPGSGSAAALLSILAAKMVITVCNISSRKDECLPYHKNFSFILSKVTKEIEPRLRDLFESDARDFERVVELRVQRDSAVDANEKAKCSRESLDLLQVATDYTFEVAELSLSIMGYGINMFDDGWHAIRGDSGVAISAAMSGVMSSIFIINLNLKTLRRRKYALDNLKRCQAIQSRLEELQLKAFSCVASISSESLKSIQLELVG
ncbi:cyclodeaminase/cyclohydrolase family protein [Pseudomonas chlororaphis]|uniref:Methenyltetrahydrofolate cyclohydrolase n=1 Tax=Pseudomonas chlororaphis subsp. aureofaciens TaxID=587851 RepID=A0AAD1E8G4_9PSED|nr:cyclodeaminase/cyclohydrolase family protein [Pseudomonas chlororaphis]AZE00996.1 Methenyltetrahydrofolate cyclohydrolase [Pseudomonas chlororaphis subsp. aureofaciens]AZE31877.1 Methenyltetrahydrofolate cyclohydrolase [Pseudomonas chlororaphis subsp. aureofaciens]